MTQIVEIWQPSNNINIDYANYQATVNENFQFVWNSQHIFNGSFTSLNDITLEPLGLATSSQNYSSAAIDFKNSYWQTAAPSGTLNSGNVVAGDSGGTARVYIDGVLIASTTSKTTYNITAGTHTLKVELDHGAGGKASNSLTEDFAAGSYTLEKHYTYSSLSTLYTSWATASYTGGGAGAASATQSIYLDGNSDIVLGNFLGQSNTWTAEQLFSGIITFPTSSANQQYGVMLGQGINADETFPYIAFIGSYSANGNEQPIGVISGTGQTGWNNQIKILTNDNWDYPTVLNAEFTSSAGVITNTLYGTLKSQNNILDDGSGSVSIAGNISTKHEFVTADYTFSRTPTDWIGTATLGSGNRLTINTGRTTLVFYNYYGGATPSTGGTVHWNHGNNDSGMALVESGAWFQSSANCTYFWIAL